MVFLIAWENFVLASLCSHIILQEQSSHISPPKPGQWRVSLPDSHVVLSSHPTSDGNDTEDSSIRETGKRNTAKWEH